MLTKTFPALAALASLALLAQAASAQTWQTVDDFQYAPTDESANQGLTVTPSGVIYACGYGYDANSLPHALIMASADDGATWSAPLDDFTNGGGYFAYYNGITSDHNGSLYAVGYYFLESGAPPNYWFVRRSLDGGATWTTTDVYSAPSTCWMTQPYGVTADAAGNVYVAGFSDTYGWLVRKGTGGANFATVDAVPTTCSGGAYAIYAHPTAGIFAVGMGPIGTSKTKTTYYGWLVRRSTDGGATWSSVDTFSLSSGSQVSRAYGIGADALGNLYVVGRADAITGSGRTQTVVSHWIVRKSANGGSSWSTLDDQAGGQNYTQASAFGTDSAGNLFVGGMLNGAWTVRESAGGSGAWQTVDSLPAAGGAALALAPDSLGHMFVGGYMGNDWVVRKH